MRSTLLSAGLLLSACVRVGYAPAPDANDVVVREAAAPVADAPPTGTEGNLPADGSPPPPPPVDGLSMTVGVDKTSDVCSDADTIDVAGGSQPIALLIDTSGASDDYGPCCGVPGTTDVVVRLVNLPAAGPMIRCWGGGQLGATFGQGACGAGSSCGSYHCGGSSQSSIPLLGASAAEIVFCRDPALGPVSVTLSWN